MNLKAIYYALSRMFLPTLSVILLALMWSLSPTKTFSFLLSDNTWASVIRIILMIAEMVWFWYLYDRFTIKEAQDQAIKNDQGVHYNWTYGSIGNNIKEISGQEYNVPYPVTHLKEQKIFVVKY